MILSNSHTQQFLRAILLVQATIGVLLEFLHVSANEHLAQLDEIAVILVVDFNRAPGVGTTADLSTVGRGDNRIGTNDGEGDLALLKCEFSYGTLFTIHFKTRSNQLTMISSFSAIVSSSS